VTATSTKFRTTTIAAAKGAAVLLSSNGAFTNVKDVVELLQRGGPQNPVTRREYADACTPRVARSPRVFGITGPEVRNITISGRTPL